MERMHSPTAVRQAYNPGLVLLLARACSFIHRHLPISRGVFVAEDQRPNDTPNATSPNDGGGAERSLPLAQNVVCLVGKTERDIRESGTDDEERPKVSNVAVFRKSKNTDSDDLKEAVEEKERGSQIPFVGEIALADAENDSKDVALW